MVDGGWWMVGGLGAIYCYPNLDVIIGHRGLLRVSVEVTGESTHAGGSGWANREVGGNALSALVEFVHLVEETLVAQWNSWRFPQSPIHPHTHPHEGKVPSDRWCPIKASAMLACRLMPSQTADNILATLRSILTSAIDSHNHQLGRSRLQGGIYAKANLPSASIPLTHPLAQTCLEVCSEKGIQSKARGRGPANEGYMLIGGAGIPTICGFGPIGGNAHAAGEWVDVGRVWKQRFNSAPPIVERYTVGCDSLVETT